MGDEHFSFILTRFGLVVQTAGVGISGKVGGCTVVTCIMTLLLIVTMFITSHHAALSGFPSTQPRSFPAFSPLSRISAYVTLSLVLSILELTRFCH